MFLTKVNPSQFSCSRIFLLELELELEKTRIIMQASVFHVPVTQKDRKEASCPGEMGLEYPRSCNKKIGHVQWQTWKFPQVW